MGFDASKATLPELFTTYRAILAELRGRKLIRTDNASAGDYAEYLVAKVLGAKLAGLELGHGGEVELERDGPGDRACVDRRELHEEIVRVLPIDERLAVVPVWSRSGSPRSPR